MELKLCGINKKYGSQYALKDFDIVFKDGVYGILGANGAGKTTLINIIIGVLKETSGEVYLNGKSIRKMGTAYLDKIGYLPQYPQFYPNFTVKEFLDYMCCLKGIPKKNRKARIDEVLELVNLQENEAKRVGALSGGMRQRLGIGQAILNEPEILVLDEPTAGLDPGERIRFRNIISKLSKDRMVLVATHIVSDVEYIANEIIIMQEGRLVKKGTGTQLTKSLKGNIWVIKTNEGEAGRLAEKYLVANMKREEGSVFFRIISSSKPNPEAKEAEPQLEDVFLSIFGKQAGI